MQQESSLNLMKLFHDNLIKNKKYKSPVELNIMQITKTQLFCSFS